MRFGGTWESRNSGELAIGIAAFACIEAHTIPTPYRKYRTFASGVFMTERVAVPMEYSRAIRL
jgi:hypothetical protein